MVALADRLHEKLGGLEKNQEESMNNVMLEVGLIVPGEPFMLLFFVFCDLS